MLATSDVARNDRAAGMTGLAGGKDALKQLGESIWAASAEEAVAPSMIALISGRRRREHRAGKIRLC